MNVKEGWDDFWRLREKITFYTCLSMPGFKLLSIGMLIFSESSFKLIPDWLISCTTEKSEVSSAKSLGFELKLSDKLLI